MRQAARDTIDKKWVDTLRKKWKVWAQTSMSSGAQDLEVLFREARKWIESLSRDLSFSKGFFTFLDEDNKSEIYKWKTKALGHLKSILVLLSSGIHAVQFWDAVATPGSSEYNRGAGHRLSLIQGQASVEGLDPPKTLQEADALIHEKPLLLERALARQFRGIRDEVVTRADKEFSRQFLALLSKIIGKFGDIEWGSNEREFSVGRVKVVMLDLPHSFPQERGSLRHPSSGRSYVPHLQEAEMLLKQKGLSFLWYGNLLIFCEDCGGTNERGSHFGVGARYSPTRDELYIYQAPRRGLARMIAHELGHRYYYKFMSSEDRARFNALFRDVPAVSEYGASSAEEDFAEVFSYYIDGRDLTRDQLERFKVFLRSKRGSLVPSIVARYREVKPKNRAG